MQDNQKVIGSSPIVLILFCLFADLFSCVVSSKFLIHIENTFLEELICEGDNEICFVAVRKW